MARMKLVEVDIHLVVEATESSAPHVVRKIFDRINYAFAQMSDNDRISMGYIAYDVDGRRLRRVEFGELSKEMQGMLIDTEEEAISA